MKPDNLACFVSSVR